MGDMADWLLDQQLEADWLENDGCAHGSFELHACPLEPHSDWCRCCAKCEEECQLERDINATHRPQPTESR
jgi:hypothetical protein